MADLSTTKIYGDLTVSNNIKGYRIANLDDISVIYENRSITAGNGLSGGGVLSNNLTISMGTPTGLTASTTNALTATSHTHSIATATAVGLSNASVSGVGTSTSLARADHTHAITGFSLDTHNHTLDSLSNVTITSNTTGEILKWNGTAWINNTLAEAGIQPAGSYLTTSSSFGGDVSGTYNNIVVADDSHNHIISNIDGLQIALDGKQPTGSYITTATSFGGDVSGTYDNIVVANDSHTHTATTLPSTMPPSAHTLDSHSNVTITSNSSGEILKWNGTAWINNTLAEAGIQPAGSYLTTATTFGGDVSGAYNAIVVANDSHTHDTRYYTETESDSRFVNITGDTMTGDLTINGALYATSKSFRIPHPTKEGKNITYGSLEGPENAVYIRGRMQGKVIELPDYWEHLIDEDTITVQLTPIGTKQNLVVKSVSNKKVEVQNKKLFGGIWIDYYYFIQAERKDIPKLEVEK